MYLVNALIPQTYCVVVVNILLKLLLLYYCNTNYSHVSQWILYEHVQYLNPKVPTDQPHWTSLLSGQHVTEFSRSKGALIKKNYFNALELLVFKAHSFS